MSVSEMSKNELVAVLKRLTGGPIGDYDRQAKAVILSRVLSYPVDDIMTAIAAVESTTPAIPVSTPIPAVPEGQANALADAIRAVVQSAGVDAATVNSLIDARLAALPPTQARVETVVLNPGYEPVKI